MMESNRKRGEVFGVEKDPSAAGGGATRFDLANLHIQRYGDAAIASYTLLISNATALGVQVAAHNESRVMVRQNGNWMVVHVHKSPAWPAPHVGPA